MVNFYTSGAWKTIPSSAKAQSYIGVDQNSQKMVCPSWHGAFVLRSYLKFTV